MPPNRTSRPRSVPDSLIVNWRASDPRDGAQPLVRRPVTACDACRSAKVKCGGKQDCGRCVSRGLVCSFASRAAQKSSLPAGDGVQPPSTHAAWPQDVAQEEPMIDAVHSRGSQTDMEYQRAADKENFAAEGGMNGGQNDSVRHIDLGPIDLTSDVSLGAVLPLP